MDTASQITLECVTETRATSQTVRYRERLRVPLWWWLPGMGLAALIALEVNQGIRVLPDWLAYAVLLPVVNGLSRRFERQSDRFSAKVTGRPEALASALGKLAEQNLADPSPHPLVEFFFYSHPSIGKRIAALDNEG